MKKIIVMLLLSLILAACGSAAPPEPTSTPIPAATATPLPTPTEERVESGFLTRMDGEWVPVYEDELTGPVFLPEEMGGDMGTDGQMIQYGYFGSYDVDTQIMKMYARILLVDLYREIEIQLAENQTVHCLPQTLGDTPIEEVTFLYNQSGVSFPPGSGKAQFSDLAADLDGDTYLVSVLDAPIQADQVNTAASLALICP